MIVSDEVQAQAVALATDFLKKWEGCKLTAYLDVGGVWTIGYGETGLWVHYGTVIGQATADNLLNEAVQSHTVAVASHIKRAVTAAQLAALTCFAYNVGMNAFYGSHLLTLVNLGESHAVPSELLKWDHVKGVEVPGLRNRRMAEGDLYASGSLGSVT